MANTNQTTPSANSGTAVNQADIQDPSLWRLNKILSQLDSRIGQNATTIKTVIEQTSSSGGSSASGATGVSSLIGTHTQRLAGFQASSYAVGSFFYETDRTTLYQCQLVGLANAWIWIGGQMQAALASIPTDLVTSDAGFLFFENAVYAHQVQWTGSAWQRGPGDLDHADTFHEFGAAPTDLGWLPCDGTTQNFFKYATPSTPGSRVLPNLATAAYAKSTKATYTPALSAPTVPTISGHSEAATTGITVSAAAAATVSNGTALAGATQAVVTALTSGGGGGGAVTDPGHSHNLTSANAPIALPADPIENFSVLKYYRQ